MENVTVIIESDILPTEDEFKVERAVRNIFPLIEIRLEENKGRRIKGQAQGLKVLSEFRSLLKRNKIRAAARSIMLTSISASNITVALNKQAAYAGHVSFTADPNESITKTSKSNRLACATKKTRKLNDYSFMYAMDS
jgi:predicted RNA binding protein with dsRBD fold (UPF0201 family)